ncbi:MAG: hypothetical protein IT424_13850 [Pirellulales bacterium]|nr:hypothetical protein [Pirellulales bacterium]
MNSLLGVFAAPTALSGASVLRQTAKAVAAPFETLLTSALESADKPTGADLQSGVTDGAGTLREHVAASLQQVLASLGLQPGEHVTLEVDDWTGDVTVADSHPLADAIETALRDNAELAAQLRRLGEAEGQFDGSPFKSASKLSVELGDTRSAARLQWLS